MSRLLKFLKLPLRALVTICCRHREAVALFPPKREFSARVELLSFPLAPTSMARRNVAGFDIFLCRYIQGGKSDAAGGLKIAKPFQFWKMIAHSRALAEFYVLEKAVSRGIGGCSTDKKPKNVKMQKL